MAISVDLWSILPLVLVLIVFPVVVALAVAILRFTLARRERVPIRVEASMPGQPVGPPAP